MKYLIISVAVVVLLLVGGYAYGSYATSVNHLLDDFEVAVKEKDTKQLATLLTTEEKDLKVTFDSLEGFVEFFESKPSELKSLMKHLNSQTKKNSIDGVKSYTVDLEQEDKKFVILDRKSIT